MKNKKGFTLIELLAVIVILAILLALAVPAVSKYINSAKKSTYVNNVQSYAKAAKQEVLVSSYVMPVNAGEATIIKFSTLATALDNGGKTSSYGGAFAAENSFIVIVNKNTPEEPQYAYYIAAVDDKGYGIGYTTTENNQKKQNAAAIDYDSLKEKNIVQLGSEKVSIPSLDSTIDVYTREIVDGTETYTKTSPTVKNVY